MRYGWVLLPAIGIMLALGCGSSGGNGDGGGDSGAGAGGEGATGTGGSGGSSSCSVSGLSCGDVLSADDLLSLEPEATEYSEDGRLPCDFRLPNQSGGIFQVFCGGESLLATQRMTAEEAYPGATTETDSIGSKSFELIVGSPGELGSTAEVNAVTSNGKYVFNVSMESAYSDIEAVRLLAEVIDANLSAL